MLLAQTLLTWCRGACRRCALCTNEELSPNGGCTVCGDGEWSRTGDGGGNIYLHLRKPVHSLPVPQWPKLQRLEVLISSNVISFQKLRRITW